LFARGLDGAAGQINPIDVWAGSGDRGRVVAGITRSLKIPLFTGRHFYISSASPIGSARRSQIC
jgi:hypothetical protein